MNNCNSNQTKYTLPENLTEGQKAVIEHENGDILVTASAGSGKTFTMVERAKRLIIEKKASVKNILAVTFTEKAAFEMKEKLKKALLEKIAEGGDKSLITELNDLSVADVCTMHSFCGRLIRTYFYAVGLAPDFKVIDEAEAKEIRIESIEKTFREFYEKGEKWFLTLVDKYAVGRSDKKLKEMILKAYLFCASESEPERVMDLHKKYFSEEGVQELSTLFKNYLDAKLRPVKEQTESVLNEFLSLGLNKSYNLAKTILSDIDSVLNSREISVIKSIYPYSIRLDFERKLEGRALELKEQLTECRNKFKKLVAEVGDLLLEVRLDKDSLIDIRKDTDHFIEVLKRFFEIYAELKREENALDFNDLEHFALKILSDEKIRKEVSLKYKYVFIDEYQDTNGVQEEIANKISNNNLLTVGDVKQSIYRFRGCRPEIFAKKTERMEKEGQTVVRLNDNFRSAKAVINCVNEIFNFCMTKDYFEEDYREKSQLKFGKLYPEGYEGRATVHLLKKSAEKEKVVESPRIYDVLEESKKDFSKESDYISSLITQIINEELGKTYYDLNDGKEKQITLKDVAILTRSRNSEYVRNLVSGLNKHGIDVVSEVKENVCDFPEIVMLINVLKLIDCFKQDIPLAGTLKSPIGGFTDEELFEISLFAKERDKKSSSTFSDAFEYYLLNAKTPLRERLKEFKNYFEEIRFCSDFLGAKGVLEKLIDQKNVQSYLLAEKNGNLKIERLTRFLSVARMDGKNLSVREFLSKIEGEGANEAFGFSVSGEKDAVTLMTIHASKGLEFPVVVACGLERSLNKEDEKEEIYFSRLLGFGIKDFDYENRTKRETLLRAVMKEEMRSERVKEEMRLFYVAATRAKYSLHLTFVAKEDVRSSMFSGADKFIDYIPSYIKLIEHEESEFDFVRLKKGTRKIIIGEADEQKIAKMQRDFAIEYPFVLDTLLPLKTSVTEANNLSKEEYKPTVIFKEDSTDIERGNIAHLIMEHLNFTSDLSVKEQAKAMVENQIISAEQLSKIDCDRLQNAVDSELFKRVRSKQLYREKAFIAEIDAKDALEVDSQEKVLLQGIIDLLVIDGENAYIIDYKYSQKGAVALKESYAKQLELYACAVEKALKKKVVSKTLVNLFTGEVVAL